MLTKKFALTGRALTLAERLFLAMRGNLTLDTPELYERFDLEDPLHSATFIRTCDENRIPLTTGQLEDWQYSLIIESMPLWLRLSFHPADEGMESMVLDEVWGRVLEQLRPPHFDVTKLEDVTRISSDGYWINLEHILRGSKPRKAIVMKQLRHLEIHLFQLLKMAIRADVRRRLHAEGMELYTSTRVPGCHGAWWVLDIQDIHIVVMPEKGWPKREKKGN